MSVQHYISFVFVLSETHAHLSSSILCHLSIKATWLWKCYNVFVLLVSASSEPIIPFSYFSSPAFHSAWAQWHHIPFCFVTDEDLRGRNVLHSSTIVLLRVRSRIDHSPLICSVAMSLYDIITCPLLLGICTIWTCLVILCFKWVGAYGSIHGYDVVEAHTTECYELESLWAFT